jgi:hypothetical protein
MSKSAMLKACTFLGVLTGAHVAWGACSKYEGPGFPDYTYDFDQVYAGTECRLYGKASDDSLFTPGGGNGSGLLNTTTGIAGITCPVINLHGEAQSQGAYLAEVSITGGTGWSASNCSLVSTSWDGTTIFTAPTPALSVSGSHQDFVWNSAQCDGSISAFSTYAMTCDMKGGSRVWKYEFELGVLQ